MTIPEYEAFVTYFQSFESQLRSFMPTWMCVPTNQCIAHCCFPGAIYATHFSDCFFSSLMQTLQTSGSINVILFRQAPLGGEVSSMQSYQVAFVDCCFGREQLRLQRGAGLLLKTFGERSSSTTCVVIVSFMQFGVAVFN